MLPLWILVQGMDEFDILFRSDFHQGLKGLQPQEGDLGRHAGVLGIWGIFPILDLGGKELFEFGFNEVSLR